MKTQTSSKETSTKIRKELANLAKGTLVELIIKSDAEIGNNCVFYNQYRECHVPGRHVVGYCIETSEDHLTISQSYPPKKDVVNKLKPSDVYQDGFEHTYANYGTIKGYVVLKH